MSALTPLKAVKAGVKKTSGVMPAENSYDRPRLNEMAGELLAFFGTLDPHWGSRIEIVKNDNHFDDLQTLGSLAGRILDAAEHTIVPSHPFFEPGFVPTGTSTHCPVCDKEYAPAYPGQPLCGDFECSKAFYAKKAS